MAILGMLNTEQFQSQRFKNVRRSVFYFYPNGAAPLTGLLSMLKEEDTDDPEFQWYEKRLSKQRTATVANTAGGPFATTSNVDQPSPFSVVQDNIIRVAVADATVFRIGHSVQIRSVTTSGTATPDVFGVVTNVLNALTPQLIEIRILTAVSNILNTSANIANEVFVIGSAFRQGIVDISSQIYNTPVNVPNNCQIFRTPFSMTGTALKTSVKYDDTGAYKDMAKENSVYHMIEMEKAFLFGQQTESVDPASGLPTYTTGGLLWFMNQWQLGTANGGIYGNTGSYSSGLAAGSVDTADDARIIANSSGVLNEKIYDGYLERAFRITNNVANEKLCFCGSGFLNVINQLYKSKSNLTADLPLEDTYGMNVVKHLTPFGTVYYKSHPLFSQNDTLRYNALFVDVHNLVYRYVQGRDTELLKNRQPMDADFRKDEWLTEAGIEVRFPESNMYIQNVKDYAP